MPENTICCLFRSWLIDGWMDGWKINSGKSFTKIEGEHITSGFSMSDIENKRDACKCFKKQASKINNFSKKLWRNEQEESSKKTKICYICKDVWR